MEELKKRGLKDLDTRALTAQDAAQAIYDAVKASHGKTPHTQL